MTDGTYSGTTRFEWGTAPPDSTLYIVATDSITFDTITTGDPVSFSVLNATGEMRVYRSVEWDFNYDGQTFQTDASGTDPDGSYSFTTAGSYTVAARLVDSGGFTQIVTLAITVTDPVSPAPDLSIAPDTDTILSYQNVTFSVVNSTGDVPAYSAIAWDFNYDGQTFQPVAGETDLSAVANFTTAGSQTVAVQLTDPSDNVQILTLDISIGDGTPPPPEVSVTTPATTIETGVPTTFSLSSDSGTLPAYTSIAWDFDYDWQTFQASPDATGSSATFSFDTSGTKTIAAEVTDAGGETQILTYDATIDDPPAASQSRRIAIRSRPDKA